MLFLVTFVTSIPALVLYQPVLDDPAGYIASAGREQPDPLRGVPRAAAHLANIGTAVVIFPVVKRQSEELALGYVTARLFECTFILVGIVAVLGIVTLQQEVAGAAEASVGGADAGGTLQGLATIPEALWELSLGIYCTVWGFRPESPILQPDARERRLGAMPAATPA